MSVAQTISLCHWHTQPTLSRLVHGRPLGQVTIIRVNIFGAWERQVLLCEESSACPTYQVSVPVPRHPCPTCTKVSPQLPEAVAHCSHLFSAAPAHTVSEIFAEATHRSSTSRLSRCHGSPLLTLASWNIPGCPCQEGTGATSRLCCLGLNLQNTTRKMGLKHVSGPRLHIPVAQGDGSSPKDSKWPRSHRPPLESHSQHSYVS